MSVKIHAIQTGSVQIKTAQLIRKPGGTLRILTDSHWTKALPIFAWVIDHPEGIIVVDTGDTAQTADPRYFPGWHPYYRTSVRLRVQPDQEIGAQLRHMGIAQNDVKTVVLTHLHTDHAGGLHDFPKSKILVSGPDYRLARSFGGRLLGYLPNRWPAWFEPQLLGFESTRFGSFQQQYRVTQAGDVVIVPTPGHTPGHVSVLVQSDDLTYFLAGDTSYTEQLMRDQQPDGVSPNARITRQTLANILAFANTQPLVYWPTHDPESAARLNEQRIV
ncbi:MAG: N-acyl homoserine lactonase family protein [Chloroflexota bacterium]|nr:N-acyl homoserine lactonase family protein [Chloroflexota bacterium]